MTRHKVLTYRMLFNRGACYPQRELFKEVFGYQLTINKKNLIKARSNGLDIFWFMRNFVLHANRSDYLAYVDKQWNSHRCELIYDFEEAAINIIDYFLDCDWA